MIVGYCKIVATLCQPGAQIVAPKIFVLFF